MTDPLNTHTYDGKLNIVELPDLCGIKSLSNEEKRTRGKDIKNIAIKTFNIESLKYLDGIIDSIGKDSNIDPSNNLVADDLLCLCWIYRENYDFMIELEEQLLDMKTGFCPQGRTHRLYQTLMAFI